MHLSLRPVRAGALLCAAACATYSAPPPAVTPPETTATPSGLPSGLPPAAVSPPPGAALRLGPSALRYLIHRQLHVEQDVGGQRPVDLGARVFLVATIVGPADSAGYPVTLTVDSIVPDSGAYLPPTLNFSAARGLRFTGRLASSGEVTTVVPSDSTLARGLSQFVGNPRDFYPRFPPEGLTLGAAWTDSVSRTESSGGGQVAVTSVRRARASAWEDRAGVRSLRIDVEGTHVLAGSGEQNGQPFELTGSGMHWAIEYVSADGRYLGGEERDSTSLTITVPVQGMTVPVRQVQRATITVLP